MLRVSFYGLLLVGWWQAVHTGNTIIVHAEYRKTSIQNGFHAIHAALLRYTNGDMYSYSELVLVRASAKVAVIIPTRHNANF